jgi:predicted enzyme related to lactoylglutathione lyase
MPAPAVLLNIDVPDLEAALQFYVAAFELRVGRRLGPDVVELLGSSAPLYLLAKPEGSLAFEAALRNSSPRAEPRVRDYTRHWTPVHLDFVVDDLEAALSRALAAGAELQGSIREAVWGRLALLADPFGHGFCLLQFQGKGYDELVSS